MKNDNTPLDKYCKYYMIEYYWGIFSHYVLNIFKIKLLLIQHSVLGNLCKGKSGKVSKHIRKVHKTYVRSTERRLIE